MEEKDSRRFERLAAAYGSALLGLLEQWEGQRTAALQGRLLPLALLEAGALSYGGALHRLAMAVEEQHLSYGSYALGRQPLMLEALEDDL